MLTLNAGDKPDRSFRYPTVAAPAATYTPWLRTDRSATIPVSRTIGSGELPGITFIFPPPGC